MPYEQPTSGGGQRAVTVRRNALTVDCFFAESGKLQKKIERWCGKLSELSYQFDAQGHLLRVTRDGLLVEAYQYNQAGQRIGQRSLDGGYGGLTDGILYYDEQGRLGRAGDTTFDYDPSGALTARRDCRGITRFVYGNDTKLDLVILPSGEELRYEYEQANPIGPVRRFKGGKLTVEYQWLDALRLAGYLDHEYQLEYSFIYNSSGLLDRVRIAPLPATRRPQGSAGTDWLGALVAQERGERLRGLLAERGGRLELFCGCDQVGTLKVLTDARGALVKEARYDSFGVRKSDTLPDLFMPIGFAGGLADPDTGLVRFGFRDYDPSVGRFTAPDPLGDTGGDHDLYDYCVDDPVTVNDPTGLITPLGGFLAGKIAGLVAGIAGSFGAAAGADAAKSSATGQPSSTAKDAVVSVIPEVVGSAAISAAPGIVVMAPGAAAAAGQRIVAAGQRVGAAIQTSGHASKIMTGVTHADQFAEPFIAPGPAAVISAPGLIGAGVKQFLEVYKEKYKK